jgi:hypothetical protein
MKLAAISEAKYYGTYDIKDVFPKYRKLGERMAYDNREYGFIQDAGARTIRRGNNTAVAMTVIVNKAEVPTEEEARRRLRDVFHYENLPVTEIERIASSSDRTFYFEVIYSPDGFNMNEAKYAFTDHAREVQQIIDAGKTPEFPKAHQIRFNMDDYDEIEKQMVRAFGYPLDSTSEEEGLGLRRTSWHIYDKNDVPWMVSMGAYRPNPDRATIRVQMHPQYIKEADYAGSGMPRELKRRIGETHKSVLKRGVQHHSMAVTIPFHNWLDDNEEYIEELYQAIKSVFERVIRDGGEPQNWVNRNVGKTWDVWHKFTPTLRKYLHEPSSSTMYHSYHRQLEVLTEIIYQYLLEQY